MADLKKWFPFRFRRNEDKSVPVTTTSTSPPTMATSVLPSVPSPIGQLMARMFDDPLLTSPLSMFGEMDRFFGDFAPRNFTPSIDVVDEGDHVRVSAELPGLDKDDIQLSVNEGMLTLEGDKRLEEQTEEEGCYRTERYYGRFRRVVPLPVDVDIDSAEAKFEKGVLSVRFGKTERPEKQRTIKVA